MLSGDHRLTDRLAEVLQLDCSSRVLDVDCGDGGSALRLAWRLGCRVVGVDPSDENVGAAAQRAREQGVDSLCTFLRGDAGGIDLGDGGFDAVILESTFGDRPDQTDAARELARLLRPGGRLAFVDPTLTDPAQRQQVTASVRSVGLEPGSVETGDGYAIVLATRL
jgi:ubiquinone/menaquinone biosynthesis C-methylase UbiE